MLRVLTRSMALAIVALAVMGAAPAPAPAETDPMVCLKACIDQNGADSKKACALQCGFGTGNTGNSSQPKDCGTIYKQCMQSCGTDNACKTECRKARTSCY